MISKKNLVWVACSSAMLVFTSCGKDTNLNQIFKTSGESERTDSLITEGQILFDRGDHDGAYELARKAYDRNPDNEEAAVLLGYTLLGQAGVDPFSIAKTLILKNESKTTTTNDNTNSGDLIATSSDAAGALSEFEDLINISEDDQQYLIKESRTTTNSLFDGIPSITVPFFPDDPDGPRKNVNTIKKLMEAIQVICPFVTHSSGIEGEETFIQGALVEGYDLHDCEPTKVTTKVPAKSNFLWSLAHLIEAVAYNSVLLNSNTTAALTLAGETKNPIQQKAEKLKTAPTFENITEYVDAVKELQEDINTVLSTDKDSMLYVTLANLKAVSRGFNSIVGLPANITASIDKAIETIETAASKITEAKGEGQANDLGTQSEALKEQLNKKANGDLKSSIESYNTKYSEGSPDYQQLEPAQQQEVQTKQGKLCDAYKDIAPGGIKPTGCP